MGNEIAVKGEQLPTLPPLSAREIREQVNLIQNVMKEVMVDGQHYGVVPGCGKKPSLLKPGAEKLSFVFRLRPIMSEAADIDIVDMGGGHREYRVRCHILDQHGREVATGVGSCSTMESKYRYRGGQKVPTDKPVPTAYWNLKKDGKEGEAAALIGGRGFSPAKVDGKWIICEVGEKQENPDIADTYNTVLKMAKKRAYVDGILSSTAASDIFTQDIEDLPAEIIGRTIAEPMPAQAPVHNAEPPRRKSEPAQEAKNHTPTEDQEPTPHHTPAPKRASEGQLRVIKGVLERCFPPKGRGPASFLINGEYVKTFDADTANDLNAHMEAKEELEITVEDIDKNGYKNAMIKEVAVQTYTAEASSNTGEDAPF